MASSGTNQKTTQILTCHQLPLAVYREVAAHLRQVGGVNTSLIMRSIKHDPQAKFDYYQSQVTALEISYTEDISDSGSQTVKDILDYYGKRYHPWENMVVGDQESGAN